MNRRSDDWHHYFLNLALISARFSKDPNTGVGAVVTDRRSMVRCMGFNGFPRGIADNERLRDKTAKNRLVVHAEMNAFMCAARTSVSLERCSLYIACTDASGEIWGGPPCVNCTKHAIQAGISTIYAYPLKGESSWSEDLKEALRLLEEAGVSFRALPVPKSQPWYPAGYVDARKTIVPSA